MPQGRSHEELMRVETRQFGVYVMGEQDKATAAMLTSQDGMLARDMKGF